ncbi:hypothetical protein B0H13DRAFT_2116437 [Mycena leptocephala]|nr:hypothetical protein B0H13DRAFT_2116437 [Mycena leptocephala]
MHRVVSLRYLFLVSSLPRPHLALPSIPISYRHLPINFVPLIASSHVPTFLPATLSCYQFAVNETSTNMPFPSFSFAFLRSAASPNPSSPCFPRNTLHKLPPHPFSGFPSLYHTNPRLEPVPRA